MAQLYKLLFIVRYIQLIIIIVSSISADQIWPTDKDTNVVGKETDTVILKCSYESSSQYIRIYWYKQYPHSAPHFLLYKGARSVTAERKPSDTRLESKTTTSSAELSIRDLKFSDSALYHCALRTETIRGRTGSWSTTNPLTFGKPISLQVEPKEVAQILPTLSILTPTGSQSKHVCLAAGFSPKNGRITLSGGDKPITESVDNAVLSQTRAYYYAAFSDSVIETCEMNGVKTERNAAKPTLEPLNCDVTKTTDAQTDEQRNVTGLHETILNGDPKGNTMLLVVTGLRVLLAKAVGVNIMMTVKALFF